MFGHTYRNSESLMVIDIPPDTMGRRGKQWWQRQERHGHSRTLSGWRESGIVHCTTPFREGVAGKVMTGWVRPRHQ